MTTGEQARARVEVTVVLTVLNEGPAIDGLMGSLLGGSRLPDAIVIVDGGSRDDTWRRLEAYLHGDVPLELVHLPGYNIAAGRNEAFRRATTAWVAVTDAGVRLSPDWLDRLMEPVERVDESDQPDAVAGFFESDPSSLFETALGAVTLPRLDEIDPTSFLPSSRSFACTRAAWAHVGGYPEWLDYGEDLVFDLRLRLSGARFAWAPDAVARFRPRPNLSAFWRQYYRYARGDGKAILWPRRHAIRYGTYASGALALSVGVRHDALRLPLLVVLTLASLAYLRRPIARSNSSRLPWRRRLGVLALLPLLRLTGDLAKMVGFPVGLRWRFDHKPPNWRKDGIAILHTGNR